MNNKIIYILLSLAGMLLLTGEARSQTPAQRTTLVNNLNTALASLVTTGPNTVTVTIPAGITVKGYDGECVAPVAAELSYSPVRPSIVSLGVKLRNATTMDVPEFSHVLVCELNNMLWHLFNGNRGQNWTVEGEDITIHDWNYDANCSMGTDQKFWMIREGHVTPDMESTPGIWNPLGVNDGRLTNISVPLSPVEENGPVYAADFVDPTEGDTNVWIARRHEADDGRIEIKRAYTRIDFDYDYHDGGVPGLPSTTHEYVEPFSFGYSKKLTGIKLEARIHAYGPDDCAQPTPPALPIAPLSDRAELIMTLYYKDAMGNACSTSCVESWSETPADPDADNEELWDRMFGDKGTWLGRFDIDQDGVLFFESTSCTNGTGCANNPQTFGLIRLRDQSVPADMCEMTLGLGGGFEVDDMTNEVIYRDGSIVDNILCFEFCETVSSYLTFENVISASAQTFASDWQYDPATHGSWNTGQPSAGAYSPYYGLPDNSFQRSERGKWRPDKAYVYRSDVKPGVGTGRIYDDAGVFVDQTGNSTTAFRLFDWRNPDDNDPKWLNPVTIVQYAPSGESIEEHDILDIYGSAKLAHSETVPRLVAANATYDAVDFQSYEDRTPGGGGPYTDLYAHSGELSCHLADNGDYSNAVASVTLTDQIDEQGLLIKLWVKQTYNVLEANPGFGNPPIALRVAGQVYSTLAPADYNTLDPDLIHKVAQTGEWSLYQLIIEDFGAASVGDPVPIEVKNNIPTMHNDQVWIDDVRAQPLDAEMTCFVYDRHTLRLIGQFDDQHFGVYSRYNGEGTVVSLLRETERGLVTVTESQSWLLTDPRYVEGTGTSMGSVPTSSIATGSPDLGSPAFGAGRATDFDIASLRIGPEGPTVDLLGIGRTPLEDVQELLDFKSDFPKVEMESLETLLPDVPEMGRLKLLRELMELDKDRVELESEATENIDAGKEKQLRKRIDEIDVKRDEILRDKLGLTTEQIEALYKELNEASDDKETTTPTEDRKED